MFPPTAQPVAPTPSGVQLPPGVTVEPIQQMQQELPSDGELIAEANTFFEQKSEERRPYEMDWFLNAAAVRLASDARFHPLSSQLEPILGRQPSHRRYIRINRTRVKYQAKLAKYTNSRPRPIVIPASEDREDILDAEVTEMALKYIWRKIDLEAKYEEVTANAEITGKSFWAFRWDAEAKALIRDPETGKPVEVTLGDVEVDVVPAFEILVDDQGIQFIGRQPRMMRARLELVADLELRYQLPPGTIAGDASSEDLFQFQKQIAGLGAKYNTGSVIAGETAGTNAAEKDRKKDYVIVKEFFKRPNAKFKDGFYAVIAGGKVLRKAPRLPYGFAAAFRSNPYPFEEFASGLSPGQFWPTTMVEQLRPVQENYNTFRSKLVEHLILNMHGKLFYPRRAGVPDGAWNSEPGEKIPFNWIPGMPVPFVVNPPPLSSDAWRMLDMNIREFDEVSNISASSLGMGTDAESGYQSVVLQEANDTVFGPDRNRMQRALASSLGKIRKLMSIGYTDERLVSAVGRSYAGTVFTFSQANIDESAEIIVQIGSALPDGKAARLESIMNLKNSGLFGNGEDPRVKRAMLDLVDLGGIEREVDPFYQDADRARLENLNASQGVKLKPPLPWHKDEVHVPYHEEQLNSPEFDTWPPEAQLELIRHYLLHLRKSDPIKGLETARMFAAEDMAIAQMVPMFEEIVAIATAQPQPAEGAPASPAGTPNSGGAVPAVPQAA
jgi:hypothetical protein